MTYEWLLAELERIRTRKFHQLDGPIGDAAAGLGMPHLEPSGYLDYLRQVGSGRFFRQSLFGYKLGVYNLPKPHPGYPSFFQIAYDDGDLVYANLGHPGVFDKRKTPLAGSFGDWLMDAYKRIKSSYTPAQWNSIESGPPPFDAAEQVVINAREKFEWRDAGFAPDGDRLIEILNASSIFLSALTLRVVSNDGRLNGAIVVDVSKLAPGSREVFPMSCYKKLIDPAELRLHSISDVGPEDRDFLDELKAGEGDLGRPG